MVDPGRTIAAGCQAHRTVEDDAKVLIGFPGSDFMRCITKAHTGQYGQGKKSQPVGTGMARLLRGMWHQLGSRP